MQNHTAEKHRIQLSIFAACWATTSHLANRTPRAQGSVARHLGLHSLPVVGHLPIACPVLRILRPGFLPYCVPFLSRAACLESRCPCQMPALTDDGRNRHLLIPLSVPHTYIPEMRC